MECQLQLNIESQPTDTTCGPTCLHAVYQYYGDSVPLQQIVDEVPTVEGGGTLAVFLAHHALRRGYGARIYSYNVQLLDPTWFLGDMTAFRRHLGAQLAARSNRKLRQATEAYIKYLELGGELRFQDLTRTLIRKHLNRSEPILTGLSATYLHRSAREQEDGTVDPIAGRPVGHFVVLTGYNREAKTVRVADPMRPNPIAESSYYEADTNRVLCSILLGIVTYDANLLIITKGDRSPATP